jgi:hypothetical protein
MDSRRGEVSRRDPRSEQGDPCGSPFFFGSRDRARGGAFPPDAAGHAAGRAAVAATLLALAAASAHGGNDADGRRSAATADMPATVVVADPTRLRALDCAGGHETGSFALPPGVRAVAALEPDGVAAFAATTDRHLLRLSIPTLEPQADRTLSFDPAALAVSGGAGATVLVGGSGDRPLSAHHARTLDVAHEYRLDDGRRATVSSIVDRPQRSRFVVAFSDLDEIWEIDYAPDAEPVLRGLVHDYRMREAIELPGRFTPRTFEVPGATRALVAGAVPYEILRIDLAGTPGILNLNVRREIERPSTGTLPDPERIAAWRGGRSRGWVLADEGAPALRVLDAASWKLVAPIVVEGEVLAIKALEDGNVLAALALPDAISLVRLDVELRRTYEVSRGTLQGVAPYRFVPGTNGCFALVDAENRWISGVAAPGKRPGS